VTSWTLSSYLSCVSQRFQGRWAYEEVEWCTNETFQLQRMAHEGVGAGAWSGGMEFIPVTEKGDELAVLDLGKGGHPRLRWSLEGEVVKGGSRSSLQAGFSA